MDTFKIKAARGSSWIPTPERYSNAKCGLINIKNEDQECFRWCMKYHQSPQTDHSSRISALKKVEDKYDYSDISYPTSYDDIYKFEERNNLCIFVYELDEDGKVHREKTGLMENYDKDHIYLLRVENDEQSHFIYIRLIGRLMNIHQHTTDKDKRFCPVCNGKIKQSEFTKHITECYRFAKESTRITLPTPGEKDKLKFHHFKNMLERPYITYADFECSHCEEVDEHGNTRTKHVPNSACFFVYAPMTILKINCGMRSVKTA